MEPSNTPGREASKNAIPLKSDSLILGNPTQSLEPFSRVENSDSYETTKRKIKAQRQQLKSKNLPIDSLSHFFEEALLKRIIPYWEGTPWSFDGHTSIPKSGIIACGYFVSTTLQDIGLNVNRYKLAQQSPQNEAKSLAIGTEVKEIAESTTSDIIAAIKELLKPGIHFIGFDASHVGYILKANDSLFLIHSNYINAAGVLIEPIEQSEVFRSYGRYYIVELSTNEGLLRRWMSNEPISVIGE